MASTTVVRSGFLTAVGDLAHEVGGQQKFSGGVWYVEGLDDAIEQAGPDDAPGPPDSGERPEVDVPSVFGCPDRDLVEALNVGHDLAQQQCLADLLDASSTRRPTE
jgi:hypothetical protein